MTRQLEIKQPFNLELSLMMGQAFRWRPLGDGWFSGIIGENLIHIRQPGGVDGPVTYRVGGPDGERPATDEDDAMLRRYFREDTDDVTAIYADISRRDEWIARLVAKYKGMRVLRQEPWECLVSYICSKSNKIPNIKQCVSEIATLSRQTVNLGDDKDERRTFPTPERILEVGMEGLLELELAGRFSRDFPSSIIAAARRVRDRDLELYPLQQQPYTDVMRTLMQGRPGNKENNGIGLKIADCVALMSLDKLEAFPVDTHIERLVNDWWFGWEKPPSYSRITQWAQDYFGPRAGYAGQFVFCDREQAGKGVLSGTPRRKISAPPRNEKPRFDDHRVRECPFCNAPPGRHCKTPGGHHLLPGHAARRSQTRATARTRRNDIPKRHRSQARRTFKNARRRR